MKSASMYAFTKNVLELVELVLTKTELTELDFLIKNITLDVI